LPKEDWPPVSPSDVSAALLRLVRTRGVVSERALVEAVAGEPVRGSWWGHPASQAIYRALESLREAPDVFLCKLLEGKQTYVHRRLWPALLRVQAEDALWPRPSAAARRLLAKVERAPGTQTTGALRLELEQSLRVVARSEHTSSGAHAVVLTPFVAHFPQSVRAEASALPLARALAELAAAGAALPAVRRTSGRPAPGKGRQSTRR
jgi:hypothetical protein